MREHALELRITHKYRDGWRGLDGWNTVGTYVVRRRFVEQLPDDADQDAEPGTLLMVETRLNGTQAFTVEQVKTALENTLSGSSCTHDWDCCGCVSSYAQADHMGANEWRVLINYTRNI